MRLQWSNICRPKRAPPVAPSHSCKHGTQPVVWARPNQSLKWTPNGMPPGPRSAFRLSCTARAWRHTAGVHLAPTLGVSQTASVAHVKIKHFSAVILRASTSSLRAASVAATPLSGRLPLRRRHLLVPRTGRLQPGAADSRCLFSATTPVSSKVSAHSFHPRPPAPPNQSLKWTPNGVPPGPRSALVHHALRGPGVTPPGST